MTDSKDIDRDVQRYMNCGLLENSFIKIVLLIIVCSSLIFNFYHAELQAAEKGEIRGNRYDETVWRLGGLQAQ